MLPSLAKIGEVQLRLDPDHPRYAEPGRYKVQSTDGGGDCLYHALANLANYHRHEKAGVYYDPRTSNANVSSFRNDVAKVLLNHWDHYSARYPEMNNSNFIQGVRTTKYAGEPELDAAMRIFEHVRVVVWVRDMHGQMMLHTIANSDDVPFVPPLWHILMDNVHYSWMTDTRTPTTAQDVPNPFEKQPPFRPLRRPPPPPPRNANALLRDLHHERMDRRHAPPSQPPSQSPSQPPSPTTTHDADLAEIMRILELDRQAAEDYEYAKKLSPSG